MQFPGKVAPKDFEFGQNKQQAHSTMGKPYGTNSENPMTFTKKHSKEFILPERA